MIIVSKRNGREYEVLPGTKYPKDLYYEKGAEKTEKPAKVEVETETKVEEKPVKAKKTTKKAKKAAEKE